jgi:hypothetical protein
VAAAGVPGFQRMSRAFDGLYRVARADEVSIVTGR